MPTSSRAAVFLLGILTTILVGWVLHVGASILQPLVIALLLASMLQPVVRAMARWRIPPALTVIMLVSLMFVGVSRVWFLLEANLKWLFQQGQREVAVERLDPLSPDQQELVQQFDWNLLVERFHDWMLERELPEFMAQIAYDALRDANVETVVADVIGGGLDFITGLVLVIIYMLFIFAEQAVFRRKILSIFEERQDDAQAVLDNIGRGIQRYLGVKTVTSLATGSLCYAALVLLDVPFALLLGLLTFALNFIPTFGSIIAGVIATFVAVVTVPEPGLATPLLVTTSYVAVNMSLGSYLEPKILGRELNLSPLVVIISVVVWAGIWGAVGTLLAVPLTAGLQIILASNENTHPIAVMLSSGPPRERKGSKKPPPRGKRKKDKAAA